MKSKKILLLSSLIFLIGIIAFHSGMIGKVPLGLAGALFGISLGMVVNIDST